MPSSLTSSEYGGRLEEEIDDIEEERLIAGNLFPVDVEEEYDVWWDVGPFESSSHLFSLLFVSEVDIENGPMGNSTNSTRTVPEALWRGEGLSSGSSALGAALYTGELRLQQNQL